MADPISGLYDTLPKHLLPGQPTIETLRKRFDEARDGNAAKARDDSQKDRDYFDGPKQLDSEVRRLLFNRKQPPIYTNRIRPAVNGILGTLELSRSDPRGLPRNPEDEDGAAVGTKVLRYIADVSGFDDVKQEVAENYFIEGTGAVIVEVINGQVVATQIRWEEFYHDPYARRHDLHDAAYMGIAKWKDADEIRAKWNAKISDIGDPLLGGVFMSSTWEDRPEGKGWIDRKRRRMMLVEEYAIIAGVWHRIVYIATGVLEYGPSPYLDDKGQPCNPIEAVSCYIDRDNKRYGIVRDMIPIQDEINASRSRSLHLMNSRQAQRKDPTSPIVAADTVREEMARADGILPPGYEAVSTAEMTQANFLRMQEAKSEIERMSPTPLARDLTQGPAVSGRARLVAQNAGNAEIARPLARLKDWRLRCYRQFWNRARQFWTQPMWIRVTDDLRTPEFLQINEPQMGMVMQQMQAPTGEVIQVPSIGVIGFNNRPAEIGMDIILDESPDTAALQEEVFAELMELIRVGVSPFSPEFELLIEMSPLQDKNRVLERLKAKRKEVEEAQAAAAQEQQKQAALMEAKVIAEIDNTQAKTAETEVKTHIAAFDAGMGSVPEPVDTAPASG